MPQSKYQEPIEGEDLDLEKKFKDVRIPKAGEGLFPKKSVGEKTGKDVEAGKKVTELEVEGKKPISPEKEAEAEVGEKRISEKLETARRVIGVRQAAPKTTVAQDAQAISQIAEYEKKIDKLMEIATHKGPEHAVKVAQHLDKSKISARADNYTMDEIHDKMENDLRERLVKKGLLKEL